MERPRLRGFAGKEPALPGWRAAMTKDRRGNPMGRDSGSWALSRIFASSMGQRKWTSENSRGKPTVMPHHRWDKRVINQMPINVAPRKFERSPRLPRAGGPAPNGPRAGPGQMEPFDRDAAQNQGAGACRNRKRRAFFWTCARRRKAYQRLPLRKAALAVRKA